LTLFFSGILPRGIQQAVTWRDRVSVVYSGGDDLFLVGAWDALPGVALEIRRQFARFTCDNPSFSLSGGLVLTGGKFPIYKSAEMAGEAEGSAKQHETAFPGRKTVKKASLTFLGTPMHWSELEEVASRHTQLVALLTDPRNGALLRRLQDIAASWESSRASLERREALTIEAIQQQLAAEKWRWRMVYALSRFTKDKPELKKEVDSLQRFITSQVGGTARQGIELLGLLARWCELSMRNEKIKEAV
jgi:CRISPR-associated protein Csm1